MASEASQMLGSDCLKQTVSSLVEPCMKATTTVENASEGSAKFTLSQSEDVKRDGPEGTSAQTEKKKLPSGKRNRSLSPSSETKKPKPENAPILIICNKELQDRSPGGDRLNSLNRLFDQLLWTIKYTTFNPFKSNEEMQRMIKALCEGLEKIVVLSRLNLTDQEFRRSLRITDTLFSLIKSYEDEKSSSTTVRINMMVDNLFDNILEHLAEEESDAEGHLKTYGFINAVVSQVNYEPFMKTLAEKLILRLYATTTTLWKACVLGPNGSVQLLHPGDINLFFFYCQLLEVLINCTPSAGRNRLQESVHKRLKILEDDAGSLFSKFPNLAFILHSTVLATGKVKSESGVSLLKEITFTSP